HLVNRKRVQRLMGLMGLEAIYQPPHTSRPAPEHRSYPYLLRGLVIERVNQVWAADICYIPMDNGFLYLVAVMDWVSRYVLALRLSNLLDSSSFDSPRDAGLCVAGFMNITGHDVNNEIGEYDEEP